jgi:hypothetical protein
MYRTYFIFLLLYIVRLWCVYNLYVVKYYSIVDMYVILKFSY